MKCVITVEIMIKPDEIIGAKEQIASALEDIGAVRIIEIKEIKRENESRYF